MSTTIVPGFDLGTKLLKAIGYTGKDVYEISLVCNASGIATMTIKRYVDTDNSDEMATILEEYTLCEKEEES